MLCWLLRGALKVCKCLPVNVINRAKKPRNFWGISTLYELLYVFVKHIIHVCSKSLCISLGLMLLSGKGGHCVNPSNIRLIHLEPPSRNHLSCIFLVTRTFMTFVAGSSAFGLPLFGPQQLLRVLPGMAFSHCERARNVCPYGFYRLLCLCSVIDDVPRTPVFLDALNHSGKR